MKLSEAVQGFLFTISANGFSKATLRNYKGQLKFFVDYCEDQAIEEVSLNDLRKFFDYLRNEYKPNRPGGDRSPLSPASIHAFWKAIRSFYRWAENELNVENIAKQIPSPKYKPPEIKPFTDMEIKALLRSCMAKEMIYKNRNGEYAKRSRNGERDKAIVLVLLDTGVRVSELCRFKVRDLNEENGELFVAPFGSGLKTKSRHVYLGFTSRKALWRYMVARRKKFKVVLPEDPLFVTQENKALNRNTVKGILDRLSKRAEVEQCNPHRFRHTAAIQYLRNGGDIFTLQRMLGHSSLAMVRYYLTLADTDVQMTHQKASPVDRWRL